MKKIAIIQSNYIPWKGYFDIINMADEFILFDDMQFNRSDWRNRNKIKTRTETQWLTIPVYCDYSEQKIKDIKISHKDWGSKHWKSIIQNYSKAEYFWKYSDIFAELFLDSKEDYLSLINHRFITTINKILGIKTQISWSSDYQLIPGKNERLIHLCRQAGATEYITGPRAKEYLDVSMFRDCGIKVTWMDYSEYPEYKQLFPPFIHEVSILDLIFNEGENAYRFMKSF